MINERYVPPASAYENPRKKLRPCEVLNKICCDGVEYENVKFQGYFHRWEQYSTVVAPSPMIGGYPGGTVAHVYAIVENAETGEVSRQSPDCIQFRDCMESGKGGKNHA